MGPGEALNFMKVFGSERNGRGKVMANQEGGRAPQILAKCQNVGGAPLVLVEANALPQC